MTSNREYAETSHSDEKDEKKGIPIVESGFAGRVYGEINGWKVLGREDTLANVLAYSYVTIEAPLLRVLEALMIDRAWYVLVG